MFCSKQPGVVSVDVHVHGHAWDAVCIEIQVRLTPGVISSMRCDEQHVRIDVIAASYDKPFQLGETRASARTQRVSKDQVRGTTIAENPRLRRPGWWMLPDVCGGRYVLATTNKVRQQVSAPCQSGN